MNESSFCLGRPDDVFVYNVEGDRWGRASVMVWGSISGDHKTPLVCIDGTLTAQHYIVNILQPIVFPFLQQHDDVTTFQQDNAPPHSAHISMEYLNNVNVNVMMPWSAYSPDLSSIEHL